MRQVPIPNNTSAHRFGVELDKTLDDGSHALGIVEITDTPSPFVADQILLRINAWQVTQDGRPVSTTELNGKTTQRKIRELVVSIPRTEYSQPVAEQQIAVAAAALEQIAGEIPAAPAPLPSAAPIAPAPTP